jgi:hypothetical protein
MILKVTLKTPDALEDAINAAPEDEQEGLRDLCLKWFRYGECVTLCIDTVEEVCYAEEAKP